MDEQWRTIPEFPNYDVSNYGEVFNRRRQRMMRLSRSNHGHMKVTLKNYEGRFTRSVVLLVAESFVESPNYMCDYPMVLDGDKENLRADNIVWRPRGFVWKYSHQLKTDQPNHYYNLPVLNVSTGAEYRSIIECGIIEGLLFEDVWRSTYERSQVFPHGYVFEIIERV